jgi:DNA modification methylase
MPDNSVHCVITSPPYWRLRDYHVARQIGLEPTIEKYIAKLVAVFTEIRRVLRPEGTLWLNMGDSYASTGSRTAHGGLSASADRHRPRKNPRNKNRMERGDVTLPPRVLSGLKRKDLVGMPWRVAFALQAAGWWLRKDIIWHKLDCTPQTVYDRPTDSHEYLFLLTKSHRYYYDWFSIRERTTGGAHSRGTGVNPKAATAPASWAHSGRSHREMEGRYPRSKQNASYSAAMAALTFAYRNKRSVWTMTSEPFMMQRCADCGEIYTGARYRRLKKDGEKKVCHCGASNWVSHFATFPMELVMPCIMAGTSEHGCCVGCGAPFKRVLEKAGKVQHKYDVPGSKDRAEARHARLGKTSALTTGETEQWKHTGWTPTCDCDLDALTAKHGYSTIPCTVFDPFAGAGTTGRAALRLGRSAILNELHPQYAELILEGVKQDAPLFNDVEIRSGKRAMAAKVGA